MEPGLPAAAASVPNNTPGEARRLILSKTALQDAIDVARPQMTNSVGRIDSGSALLALWAAGNLTWDALEAVPATSAAMFHKDPESERGKRLCLNGTIAEIRAEKSLATRLLDDRALPLITTRPYGSAASAPAGDAPGSRPQDQGVTSLLSPDGQGTQSEWTIPNDGKVFVATLREKQPAPDEHTGRTFRKPNRDELVVEIIAAKSTGQLVNRSEARACGILTGVTLPSTSSTTLPPDVTVHRIVGLFDLPQNRSGAH